jgi:hypothetical protein
VQGVFAKRVFAAKRVFTARRFTKVFFFNFLLSLVGGRSGLWQSGRRWSRSVWIIQVAFAIAVGVCVSVCVCVGVCVSEVDIHGQWP